MGKHIKTETIINAPLKRVIEVLKDTSSYSTWNPFITNIVGEIIPGNKIQVIITPPGGSRMKFTPKIITSSDEEIRWKGKLLIPGLCDGEHYFIVEEIRPNQTKLIHGELFTGLLIPLFGKTLEKTERGFNMMNQALAQEVLRRSS